MKKNYHKKGQPGHYLNKDYTIEALWINIECYAYLIDNHLECITKDVASGRITNEKVILETLELIKRVGDLVPKDISNINRCVSFVKEKFPHAIFSTYHDTIAIENLSKVEMITCLQQDGLRFDYARVDKNGDIPEEDLVR